MKRQYEDTSAMEEIQDLLKKCRDVQKPSSDSTLNILSELKEESDNFPIKFPIDTVRCKTLQSKNTSTQVLEENITSTYPIIHERVLQLMCHFLLHKRVNGTTKEQHLYKDMGIVELVDRLLKKRAVCFVGPADRYLLLNGKQGRGGWEDIGTDKEKEPLLLKDNLSYDELKLSALLYVSGHTVFINDGSRKNSGVVAKHSNNIEQAGIIIGLIGTRLNKRKVVEYQELILTKEQNCAKNGYGPKSDRFLGLGKIFKLRSENERKIWRNIWADFYGEPSLCYDDAFKLYKTESASDGNSSTKDGRPRWKRFIYERDTMFDNKIYASHLSVPFDCALLEANQRAIQKGKMAYLHVVGIGLGVWRAFMSQDISFVETILERIKVLSQKLQGLSDVHLAYMKDIPDDVLTAEGTFIKCESHPKGGINVHLSNREPSSKLIGEHANKLLVETYAWDGNAQPGNEYWWGSLKSSGDPAAACSSQVAELHNSQINKRFVCGDNLHVAGQHGVHHISQYVKLMLDDKK